MAQSIHKSVKRWHERRWAIVLLLLVGLIAYLSMLKPSNEGAWREEHARPVFAELVGRSVTIHNIRDFRRDEHQQATGQEYCSKTWELDDIERLWFGLSHFGPFGLAHSFLSVEFNDGEYLSISIEGRLRPGEDYNPLMGVLRQYTKIYVVGTEQDIIGRRSHRRGETVLLYPVNVNSEDAEQFFLALITDANAIYKTPEFYNLILDNCLTNLLKRVARLSQISATDIRVLVPGHTDRLTYAFGITPDDISFESARQHALIDPTVVGIDDSFFSAKIRCGWSKYTGLNFPACH